VPIILFGTEYWNKVFNVQTMVDYGTIAQEDMDLFHVTDSVDDAYNFIVSDLTEHALMELSPNM
jgi:hypothetical protein